MPATDDLLSALWRAIDRAADVERELDEVAGWREVEQAAIAALDRELARSRDESDTTRTIA